MNHVRRLSHVAAALLLFVSITPGRTTLAQSAGSQALTSASTPAGVTAPLNQAPAAAEDRVDDDYGSTNIILPVLANDYDPDGDPLAIINVSSNDGTAVISGSVVLFTPTGGDDQWGINYVEYTISDGRGGTASSEVEIFIMYGAIIAFAIDDFYRVPANAANYRMSVMTNDQFLYADMFPINERISIRHLGAAHHGTASITPDTPYPNVQVLYTPTAGFSGTDSFTYTLRRGTTANVFITVANGSANGAPIAADDNVQVRLNSGGFSIPVLNNDRDLDNDAIVISAVGPAQHATMAIFGNSIIYTPTTDFVVTDSFTYTISDDADLLATALVQITISSTLNMWPGFTHVTDGLVRVGQPYSATVISADADPSDVLVFSSAGLPDWLNLVDNGDRTATLSGTPTQLGIYPFTLQVSDGHLATSISVPSTLNVVPAIISSPPGPATYGSAYTNTLTVMGLAMPQPFTFTLTAGSLPPGLSLDLSGVLSGIPTTAGTYADLEITASNAETRVAQSMILTVNPAPLTITAAALSRPIGMANPVLSAHISGFVLSDAASVFSSPLVLTTTATISSPIGSYPITPGGAMADNYTIAFESGSLTVTGASVFLPSLIRP